MSLSDENRQEWLDRLQDKAATSEKSWTVALTLSIFLGVFGVDRFYLGYGVLGLVKLGTFGGFGWWWILDVLFILMNKIKDADHGIMRSPFHR